MNALSQGMQTVPGLLQSLGQYLAQHPVAAPIDFDSFFEKFPQIKELIATNPELKPLADLLHIPAQDGATPVAGEVQPASATSAVQPASMARLFPRAALPNVGGFALPGIGNVEKQLESAIRRIADGVGLEIPGMPSGAGVPAATESGAGSTLGIPGVGAQDAAEPIAAQAESRDAGTSEQSVPALLVDQR